MKTATIGAIVVVESNVKALGMAGRLNLRLYTKISAVK